LQNTKQLDSPPGSSFKKFLQKTPDRQTTKVVTSKIPAEKNFYFYTEFGKPTGIHSASIFEFSEQLRRVENQSIQYHMGRGDFSKWLGEVVQDAWLAHEFDALKGKQLPTNSLRNKLTDITNKRCRELSQAPR